MMKPALLSGKHLIKYIAGSVITLILLINITYAGYLVEPVPVPFVECISCGINHSQARPHHYKKYRIAHKYRKHQHCYQSSCAQAKDAVTFIGEPAPLHRGKWINTDKYDIYDPGRSTGDDDPTIYPGMNINN